MHQALTRRGQQLAQMGEACWLQSVRHYHGVTRATLTTDQANATAPETIAREVADRLTEVYGVQAGG